MMYTTIPLHSMIKRLIEKEPQRYISETSLTRALDLQERIEAVRMKKESAAPLKKLDFVQDLINLVTQSGRMTDSIFPISPAVFNGSRLSISLKNSKLTGKFVNGIASLCPNLQVVDLSGTLQVDDDTIAFILANCKNIREILVQNCRKMTNKLFEHIIEYNSESITAIDVGGDVNITNAGIVHFLNNYPHIKSIRRLNLSGLIANDQVINLDLIITIELSILRHILAAARLVSLSIFGMGYGDVSEPSLINFIKSRGPLLTSLNISWLGTTTGALYSQLSIDMVFEMIIQHCPLLVELDICGLKSATAQHLQHLIDQRAQLAVLDPSSKPFSTFYCRFIGTTKAQIDSSLVLSYPGIKFFT